MSLSLSNFVGDLSDNGLNLTRDKKERNTSTFSLQAIHSFDSMYIIFFSFIQYVCVCVGYV